MAKKYISDEAVKQLITNVKKELDESYHQNLLLNWYFVDPIDQYGIKEWGKDTKEQSKFDAWHSAYSGDDYYSALLTDEGLKITIKKDCDATGLIFQRLDKDLIEYLKGRDVVVSALVESEKTFRVGIRYGSEFPDGSYVENSIASGKKIVELKTKVRTDAKSMRIVISAVTAVTGDTFIIKAVKLELGSHQTLAHKEGDKWVLNDPIPNKTSELEKCKRRYQTTGAGSVFVVNGSNIQYTCKFPVDMRANPTVKLLKNTFSLSNGSTTYNFSSASISNQSTCPDGCKCVTLTGSFSSSTPSTGSVLRYDGTDPILAFDASL